ncbi:hypothetical protein PFV2_gp05 [Pyrobaculum filamentous virus 2]|uniref:Uncharacterized protein n=1 Tax=Pyrobaculum filamentous virus 2 TaxID=2730621 RepID=A0A6M3VWZ5_PFV2|nr:hypothetical protein QIT34_gp05 [Pyrobaculum filamentous virus 2]QJF12378.1 hypothetical protein PFV2_gp05 [Pyrobaculum filamentous virus 2]
MIRVPIVSTDWFLCGVAVYNEKGKYIKPKIETINGYIDLHEYHLKEGNYWVVYVKCVYDLFDKRIEKLVGVRYMKVWRDGSTEIIGLWIVNDVNNMPSELPDFVKQAVLELW